MLTQTPNDAFAPKGHDLGTLSARVDVLTEVVSALASLPGAQEVIHAAAQRVLEAVPQDTGEFYDMEARRFAESVTRR
ncbi:hypothetical protein [Muricoccus roseus]|nr:hypothetical protein [Roseomonas rosea]